ncbi:MAG TPA: hypothetical protein VJB08_06605 [Candidatus Nanoarchaeia archaeon]|nr:hypothetical protein [Candidatus Nanoarchaeia archaeon]
MNCAGCECEETPRQFLTNEEKIEKLQEYKNWLEKEAKGVAEAMSRIKKGM